MPEFLHPDAPRGPSITAIDRQTAITTLAAKLQNRMTDVLTAVYATDVRGVYWNIDAGSGRILCPLPWAEFSHRAYGLVRSECDVMRLCVRHYRQQMRGPFYYNRRATRWYLDITAWPTLAAVTARPDVWVITPELVLAADNHRRGLPYDGQNRG